VSIRRVDQRLDPDNPRIVDVALSAWIVDVALSAWIVDVALSAVDV